MSFSHFSPASTKSFMMVLRSTPVMRSVLADRVAFDQELQGQ